jgi:hypothetical protein
MHGMIRIKFTYTLFISHGKIEGYKRNYVRGMMGMEHVKKMSDSVTNHKIAWS